MKCQNSHCTKEATTEDHPGYTPITVAKNAGIQTAPSTYDTLPESV